MSFANLGLAPDEVPLLRDIEKLLARTLAITPLPAYAVCGSRRRERQ